MIKGIPSHLQILNDKMDAIEKERGYPALCISLVSEEKMFVEGLKEIGSSFGFMICEDDESESYRIMPYETDIKGMIQFSYVVGCYMERCVWSKKQK